jgi:adenylate cyclase
MDEADRVLGECLLRAPRDADCLLIRVALQMSRGELEQAQATMAQLLAAKPEFSIAAERDYRRFGNSPLMDRFLSDLARAKAPETAAGQAKGRAA